MAEEAAPQGAAGSETQQPPRLSILTQYVKDLSFENPKAPQGLQAAAQRPQIEIKVDVNAKGVGEGQYEVSLQLNVQAKAEEDTIFLLELAYGGVFTLANIPQDSLQPLLLIECPRLLFPFARRIVADTTRDGGFPPLMIDPIDFVTLYRRKVQEAQGQAQAASETSPSNIV